MFDEVKGSWERRLAGSLLIGLTALSLFFITHHPTLGAPGYESLADESMAEASSNRTVHGALILVVVGFFIALSVLSDRLGRDRFDVRAAQLSLAAATMAMIGAALVSGFIIPATAESLLQQELAASFPSIFYALVAVNGALASFATAAYGAAIAIWSTQLAGKRGVARVGGFVGLAVGPALLGSVLTGLLDLSVAGMTMALAAMGAWFVLVGIVLVTGRLGEDSAVA